MRSLCLGLLLAATIAFGRVRAIDPPPPGHWAVDTSGAISQDTLSRLDTFGAEADESGRGQLGVLIVRTTAGEVPRTFATNVFNSWGIGHAGTNDGVLLFVATEDHKAEIILGDGLRARVPTSATDAVMREQVVRNFRAGHAEAALLEGAEALVRLLKAGSATAVPTPAASRGPISRQDELSEARVTKLFSTGELDDPSPRRWLIDLTGEVPPDAVHALERVPNDLYVSGPRHLFLVVFRSRTFGALEVRDRTLAALSMAHPKAALVAVNLERPDAAAALPKDLRGDPRAEALEAQVEGAGRITGNWPALTASLDALGEVLRHGFPERPPTEVLTEALDRHGTAFGGGGVVFALGGVLWLRRWNRYRSRACENCHRPRQLLGVGREDPYLSAGQQAEQNVGSVDYDVWWCGVCHDVLVRDNTAWFSGYSRCNSCSHRTLKSSSTTVSRATEYSGGLVEVVETCSHCHYQNTFTRTTAQLSSSSSSWSDSSSSSSSDSSFGGGSSSGDGSSGSW